MTFECRPSFSLSSLFLSISYLLSQESPKEVKRLKCATLKCDILQTSLLLLSCLSCSPLTLVPSAVNDINDMNISKRFMIVLGNDKDWKYKKPIQRKKYASKKDLKGTKRIVAELSNLHFLLFLGFRSDLNRPLEKKLSSVANFQQTSHATIGSNSNVWGVSREAAFSKFMQ